MMPKLLLTAICATLIGSSACLTPAHAMPVRPTNAPLERLLKNTNAYLKTHPKDPEAYFVRGRLHYFAFALNRSDIPVFGDADKGLPRPTELTRPSSYSRYDTPPKIVLSEERRKKLPLLAIADLKRAIALRDVKKEQQPGLYELTLACVYEDSKELASKDWREQAIHFYRASYEQSAKADHFPSTYSFASRVSQEAGQSYLRLTKARGMKPAEMVFATKIQQNIKRINSLPRAVTPIVFSLQENTSLTELLHTPKRPVTFDLAGAEKAQRYAQWPTPTTAILVWNPNGEGRITSGRQLFGTATWWMMYKNGYRALNALDNDGNGWLEGKELDGLALWFDRNSNGVSEKGEVVAITASSIAGIAVQATTDKEGVLTNQQGLRLKDGTLLPTYDWVVTPL